MSRHRIVRTMDYNDEYDGYDDVYGHSVDDDTCISPSDASQWLYDRARGQQSISAFMANNRNIEEEDEDEHCENGDEHEKKRRDSENFQMPVLGDIEQAKLISCIEEIRSVVGDTVSERQIVETTMKYDYDVTKVLDTILNASATSQQIVDGPKPSKDTIEKDFKQKCTINNMTFKLPSSLNKQNINMTDNTSKLSEYMKNKIQGSCTPETQATFVVPQLKPSNALAGHSPKLKQFISAQLTSNSNSTSNPVNIASSTKFNIPNLLSSSLGKESISFTKDESPKTHELLFKKIMESRNSLKTDSPSLNNTKISLPSINNTDHIIDLTKALSGSSINVTRPSNKIKEDIVEKFAIPFIDCDRLAPKNTEILHYCQIDISCVLKENLSESIAKPTNFGKILSMTYKCRKRPYVKHEFNPKYDPIRFQFETKSPDDIILSHLKKI